MAKPRKVWIWTDETYKNANVLSDIKKLLYGTDPSLKEFNEKSKLEELVEKLIQNNPHNPKYSKLKTLLQQFLTELNKEYQHHPKPKYAYQRWEKIEDDAR